MNHLQPPSLAKSCMTLSLLFGLLGVAALPVQAAPAPPPGDIKGLMVRFYDEVMNQNKLDQAEKYIAANGIEHDSMMSNSPSIIENVKDVMTAMHAGFPDLRYQVEDMILDGDRIAVRYHLTGTHKGKFMGIDPTGKPIDIHGVDVMRIGNGKVVEHWTYMDSMIMLQQLGLVPGL